MAGSNLDGMARSNVDGDCAVHTMKEQQKII